MRHVNITYKLQDTPVITLRDSLMSIVRNFATQTKPFKYMYKLREICTVLI